MRLIVALLILTSSLSYAASPNATNGANRTPAGKMVPPQTKDVKAIESMDREVDVAALESMKLGARTLLTLWAKRKNTSGEPDVLIKLIELYKKMYTVQFRIAHGRTGDVQAAQTTLKQEIQLLNRLITTYPRHPFVPKAYLARGKAYKDLGDNVKAEADFLYLPDKFPMNELSPLGLLFLSELLMDAKNYPRAITYLKRLETMSRRPFYPMVLEHLAWAYYSMGDIGLALKYNDIKLAYHEANSAKSKTEFGDMEITGMNSALFYSKAIEKKLPGFSVENAYPYLTKIMRSADAGKVYIRFAQHLRTEGAENQLEVWERILFKNNPGRPETLEVFFVNLEDEVNQRRYPQLAANLKDFRGWVAENGIVGDRRKNADKILSYLSTAASYLQAILAAHPGETDRIRTVGQLENLYSEMLSFAGADDKTAAKIHYNLAELNFEQKNFQGAENNYRWFVDRVSIKDNTDGPLVLKASLNAIAARYEILRQRGIIPKDLKAQSLSAEKTTELNPMLVQWIEWIKSYQKLVPNESLETFIFESNRAIYAQGHIQDALFRLSVFAERWPKSQYAIPSVSLILDTLIASQRWDKAHEIARKFLDKPDWKGTDFYKKLGVIAADVSFKMIETTFKQGNFADSMKRSEEFMRLYPASDKITQCLALAANSSLGLKDKNKALFYFSQIMDKNPPADVLGPALLTKASVEEDNFDFESAAHEIRTYLHKFSDSTSDADGKALRRKAAFLAMVSNNRDEVEATLWDRKICNEENEEQCEQIKVVMELMHPGFMERQLKTHSKNKHIKSLGRLAYSKMKKSNDSNRAIWGTIALQSPDLFLWKDRMELIEEVASGWSGENPIIKYVLLPYISDEIPAAFQLSRQEVKRAAPLKVRKDLIDRRVTLMKALEDSGAKVVALPWVRIRASVFNELASLYADFANELNGLPVPGGLTGEDLSNYKNSIKQIVSPFVAKAQQYRKQAFDLATEFAIEDHNLNQVASSMFKENPGMGDDMKKNWMAYKVRTISESMLKTVDPQGGWFDATPQSNNLTRNYQSRLYKSLASRNWPAVALMLQIGKEKNFVPGSFFNICKAISLVIAGARGEGVGALEESLVDLNKEQKRVVLISLISHYFDSYARDKTKTYIVKYLENDKEPPAADDVKLLADAARWSGVDSSDERIKL